MKLILLIDGLGWDLLQSRSFLDDVLVYRRPVPGVFGFSAGVIPSILTGKYPQEHLHWGLFYYSPQTSPFRWARGFAPFPDSWFAGRVWRHLVERISRRRARYSGYFETYLVPIKLLQFFDLCESRDLYQPGGVRAAPTIFDWLLERRIPWRAYSYHELEDRAILQAAGRDAEQGTAQALFLYLSAFDAFLHAHRHEESAITARLAQYEAGVTELFERAVRKHPSTQLLICSDHGMTPVRWRIDLMARIEALRLKVPHELIPMYDSTMARFWFRSDRARERVLEVLSQTEGGQVLSEGELRRYGVFFQDHRYGELIFALESGGVIEPSYMGRIAPQGMHGYRPEDPGMTACLLTNFPVSRPLHDLTGLRGVLEDLFERP